MNPMTTTALRAATCWRATIAAVTLAMIATAAVAAPKSFASPEDGVSALAAAVEMNDQSALAAMLGPRGGRLISSGDAIADAHNREIFSKSYSEAHSIRLEGRSRAVLLTGNDEWPLPIPLVKAGNGRWHFDAGSGEKEILTRRIGRNELAAIQVCLAIVDAEREYAARNPDKNSVRRYAARLVSSPDRHDGLYWPTAEDELPSPLGPLLAAAAVEGYAGNAAFPLTPYHGYYYRIVTAQGRHAAGGAYEYGNDNSGGFGVIAYPARHGASGVMTFAVNHDGIVYEKNLGKNTSAIAATLKLFDPDATWKRP